MKKGILFLLVVTIAAGIAPAHANGPYLGVHGGAAFLNDFDINGSRSRFDPGINLGGTAGYAFARARVEGELTYRRNSADSVTLAGTRLPAEGNVASLTMMVNGFYDIHTNTPLTPYVGGGLGIVQVWFNDVKAPGSSITGNDNRLATQFALGVAYKINDAIDLDFGYRFFVSDEFKFRNQAGQEDQNTYGSHNLTVGLRINL